MVLFNFIVLKVPLKLNPHQWVIRCYGTLDVISKQHVHPIDTLSNCNPTSICMYMYAFVYFHVATFKLKFIKFSNFATNELG